MLSLLQRLHLWCPTCRDLRHLPKPRSLRYGPFTHQMIRERRWALLMVDVINQQYLLRCQ